MSLEKSIEKKVCDYAKTKGFLTPKINVVGETGWPDRLFIDPDGWCVWIEFKAPGKVSDAIQVFRQGILAARGFIVLVIDNEEEGIQNVDDLVSARLSDKGDKDDVIPGERRIITGPWTGKN